MIKVECQDAKCKGVFRSSRAHIERAGDNLSCPFCGGDHVKAGG